MSWVNRFLQWERKNSECGVACEAEIGGAIVKYQKYENAPFSLAIQFNLSSKLYQTSLISIPVKVLEVQPAKY